VVEPGLGVILASGEQKWRGRNVDEVSAAVFDFRLAERIIRVALDDRPAGICQRGDAPQRILLEEIRAGALDHFHRVVYPASVNILGSDVVAAVPFFDEALARIHILRHRPIDDLLDPPTQCVILVAGARSAFAGRDEMAHAVIAERPNPVARQASVRVVGIGIEIGLGVLVQVVDRVAGHREVVQQGRPIAEGVIRVGHRPALARCEVVSILRPFLLGTLKIISRKECLSFRSTALP